MANDKAFKVKNGLELGAYDAVISSTAVDVFVYDTSKDSDGGAWRKRTQHTSWYNETLNTATRGSRRKFPAVAVIVAEATKITIYDGDDPALPMWMVFNANRNGTAAYGDATYPISSLTAQNGEIVQGASGSVGGGLAQISFLKDESFIRVNSTSRYFRKVLSNRNSTSTLLEAGAVEAIVDRGVNDVAMTVLPDAPIDPATGLPVPVIAAATNGGVSVIKDDGTVVSKTYASGLSYDVSLAGNTAFITGIGPDSYYNQWTWDFINDVVRGYNGRTVSQLPTVIGNATNTLVDVADDTLSFWGWNNASGRLVALLRNTAAPSASMAAYVTSTYNTGWMNGDIKGAFLSSTDTASLVGSGELVTNGTFDTDTSGWTAEPNATATWNAGAMEVVVTTSNDWVYQAIATIVGATYQISFDFTKNGGGRFFVGNSVGSGSTLAGATNGGSYVQTFVATATTTYIYIGDPALTGTTQVVDNISVKLADADRSVNNKGLIVNGTVTRSPVATGAELVAYSGFSSINYIEQPYNSALDFGTGDFCVMGWVNASVFNSVDAYVVRSSVSTAGGGWLLGAASGTLKFWETQATGYGSKVSGAVLPLNTWNHVALVRRAGVIYTYQGGQLTASAAFTNNINHSTPSMSLGYDSDFNSYAAAGTKMALWRISATAPTAEQIAKIYEDEKVLFQENAAATLYGTSDAVTALAHDEDTGLLHVGTSAGRSVFQGLRRVSNTTTAVGTAISASGGMVVEE